MTIKYLSGNRLQGTSSDTKPTNVPLGSVFEETNTRYEFLFASKGLTGSSGTGSNWKEVEFDNSTIRGTAQASGNVVSRSSGSGWNVYIRSTKDSISPQTGGGEVYFTGISSGSGSNISFGLCQEPYDRAGASNAHETRNYSFHCTTGSNKIYEFDHLENGSNWTSSSNEYRIVIGAASPGDGGRVTYYWRSGNSGSWTTDRDINLPNYPGFNANGWSAYGRYYVSVTPAATGNSVTCYIKSPTAWVRRGDPVLQQGQESSTGVY